MSTSPLADLYRRITEDQDRGPDGIEPAVKALIASWEEKVSKTIRGARKLLRSKKKDHRVINRYILLMEGDASTIKKHCIPRTHSVYKKLIKSEDVLNLLIDRLRAKIKEEETPS